MRNGCPYHTHVPLIRKRNVGGKATLAQQQYPVFETRDGPADEFLFWFNHGCSDPHSAYPGASWNPGPRLPCSERSFMGPRFRGDEQLRGSTINTLLPHFFRRRTNGLDDVLVPGAAAEVG